MNKKKILIVDDEPDNLTLTSMRLKSFGYETLTAANGYEAVKIIKEQKPDLLLLDLVIPIVYGTELCRHIKNDEQLKHIPIILFTAFDDIMTAKKAEELGASGYITKPFDAEELIDKVEQVLANSASS